MADQVDEQHDRTPDTAPRQHRLEVRCPSGNPSKATIHLDGQQLLFVSRVELVLDAQTREAAVRLTVPAAVLDLDVDAAAFVTAHSSDTPVPTENQVHVHVGGTVMTENMQQAVRGAQRRQAQEERRRRGIRP
ncbi:hypothetical protein [Actinacidiphila acididurans]|uniref:Uncharacterized protein n=1 Tax=Actinacidiphila acididurans TaxID=2784346 RepID=A0ABS2U743_9ACTN|nr:hypothetical protein [Actinacidiphila acididurans]MBM9509978.1 hypothetical protein [Actinacidiphila acididurans]